MLFYVAILMTVDLYARKNNIKGVPESELPTWKELVKNVYLILPLIYLIVSMSVFKMSVTKSGITSIIATIVCTLFFRPKPDQPRRSLKRL